MNVTKSQVAIVTSAIAMAVLSGCNNDSKDKTSSTEIRWTSYGVPHIKADNYTDLGEGLGYVMAKDRYCNIAKAIVTSKGELSKHLGAGIDDANVNSDFAYLHLGTYQEAKDDFANLDIRVQELMQGFAAGFNHAIDNKQHFSADCQVNLNAIDHADVFAVNLSINYWSFIKDFIQDIGSAEYSDKNRVAKQLNQIIKDDSSKSLAELAKGSNGWALGKDMTSSGKGMVLSNTHLEHRDEFTWYEAQLTIPNELNVYGGFLPGFVTPALGFNETFSWTHTWTNATTGSAYILSPGSQNELHYLYDDTDKPLTAFDYKIIVKAQDGSLVEKSRTLYKSHYGPVSHFDVDGTMVAIKDAPSLAKYKANFWLKLAHTKDIAEAVSLIEQGHRTGSQNIIMADKNGDTFYADLAETPKLLGTAWTIIENSPELNEYGGMVLDGSDSTFEWLDVAPYDEIPKRYSNSYVQNANESPWLVNLDEPLVGYSPMYGDFEYKQSPRTQLGVAMLEELKQKPTKVTLSDLHHAMKDKRVYLAELWIDDLVERCQAFDEYELGEEVVNLSEACDVLESWDRKANLESVGSHLFREYAVLVQVLQYHRGCDNACWTQPFESTAPLTTPSGLPEVVDASNDIHLEALANAVQLMKRADIASTATLSQYQQLIKGEMSYPIAGGIGDYTGTYSSVNVGVTDEQSYYSYTGLSDNGYDVNVGDGFVFLMEFTDQGPSAQSVLLYSQSNNPNSAHYFDQAPLIDGKYKTVKFSEQSIKADKNLITDTLRIK